MRGGDVSTSLRNFYPLEPVGDKAWACGLCRRSFAERSALVVFDNEPGLTIFILHCPVCCCPVGIVAYPW